MSILAEKCHDFPIGTGGIAGQGRVAREEAISAGHLALEVQRATQNGDIQ